MRVLKVLRTDTLQANFFYFIFHEPINKFEEIDFVTETTNHTKKIYLKNLSTDIYNIPKCTETKCTETYRRALLMCRAEIYQILKDKKFVHIYTNIHVLRALGSDTLQAHLFYFILFFMNP